MTEHIDRYAYKEISEYPIVIDFSECKTWNEFHTLLKEKFGLPEFYGKNFDGLWDLLQGLFDENIEVHLYGVDKLKKKLPICAEKMLDVFNDVHEDTPNVVFKIMS